MSEPTPKDFTSTLNLPKTAFPMKGNLATLEPTLVAQWKTQRTFEAMVAAREGSARFVLHDGPPYANGQLHAGHALNKVLKDMVVKYRTLAGYQADFVPGWDCHGLPIEQAVEKRLREQKVDKRTLSRAEFLQRCRDYALEFVDAQRTGFERMGVLGRFDQPYLTLSFDYEAQELRELATIAEKGLLVRKQKPVWWCVVDQTALAEAEIEYDEQHTSPSAFVAFEVTADLSHLSSTLTGRRVQLAVWTTTPWTLPANVAVCVHPELEYVFYALDDARAVVVAKDLLLPTLSTIAPTHLKTTSVKLGEGHFDATALTDVTRVLAYALGSDLEGLVYRHPFLARGGRVIGGAHVTLEAGTGLVHTAPGHGQDDFVVGQANGLEVLQPVKADGTFDDTVPERLRGLKVFAANPVVLQWLHELGALLNPLGETVINSYPTCWRCHTDVISRATPQWFMSLDETGLRTRALAQVDEAITWIPRWGRDRIRGMLETRPDWCLSRQRTWGVPIPVAICEGCGEARADATLMRTVADLVGQHGAAAWYETPLEHLLPAGFRCAACGGATFRKETDILDVWFDSACSFAAVAERRPHHHVPVDLYLEGSDQHRGWFHSSLLVGVATRGAAPYRACLTHGFVVDGQGNKMSKSKGNTVSPDDIIARVGAEVMRLWVASSDYRDDVRLSWTILDSLAEGYRKVRNTVRFALSNLFDFDPATNAVAEGALQPLDQWVLSRLDVLVATVRKAYEAYEFHLVAHAIIDFCAVELSSVYFAIQKDVLYTRRTDGPKRRSAQTTLHRLASELLVMLAPITSFTSEEAFAYLPGPKAASVFLADFPTPRGRGDRALIGEVEQVLSVRTAVLPLLEAARREKRLGRSEEACVRLTATRELHALLSRWLPALPELLIVSQVLLVDDAPTALTPDLKADITLAPGAKCPRCWLQALEVGAQELCQRCVDALA
jgi:isoleucyl-tRNA synthetase